MADAARLLAAIFLLATSCHRAAFQQEAAPTEPRLDPAPVIVETSRVRTPPVVTRREALTETLFGRRDKHGLT
jgi:hypothetical protein